jgi:hypothetical protein
MKKLVLFALLGVAALAGASVWWLTRTEPIPETLEEVEASPDTVEIPGLPGQPTLKLAELRGKTVVFVVAGTWSAKSPEGEDTNRALSRWVLPEDTIGYVIADAAGLGVFSDRIEATMRSYGDEVRFPLYIDYEGAFITTFKLPKGHHGLVVLGPDGAVKQRHSGGLEGEALEELRVMLGAEEPKLGPPMPQLKAGALDNTACADTVCAFVFGGPGPLLRNEIPGIRPGGFEADEEVRLAQMLKPRVRNIALARKMKLSTTRGALIGDVADDIESEGWERVGFDEGAAARAALGLGPEEPGIVVFDHGREALRATGLVRLHHWGRVADLLEVEGFNDRRPPKG